MLESALGSEADLVGGCSYRDPDLAAHIRRIFDLAGRFGVATDFHVDFDLEASGSDLPAIIAEVKRRNWPGYVACGHATKLSTWHHEHIDQIAAKLAENRIGIVSLPATDYFCVDGMSNAYPTWSSAAKLLGRAYGLTIGAPADLLLFDATEPEDILRRCGSARMG